MKIEIACAHCGNTFIGGSTHRRYCDHCREHEKTAIAREVSNRKKKPCECGKMISRESARCQSCARKASRKTVKVHCSACGAKFLPKSWRQAVGARVIFCPDCKENRITEVRKIAWAARGNKKGGMRTTDRNINRLIAEGQDTVRTLYDRNAHRGRIPENLLRQYPTLAADGSIPSTAPAPRSRTKVAPAPRVERPKVSCQNGHGVEHIYTRPDGQRRCRLCVRELNRQSKNRRIARKKGLTVVEFMHRRAAQVESHGTH